MDLAFPKALHFVGEKWIPEQKWRFFFLRRRKWQMENPYPGNRTTLQVGRKPKRKNV